MRRSTRWSIALLGLSLTAGALAGGTGHGAAHWGYEGATGPAHWGQLDPGFALCGKCRFNQLSNFCL